MWSSKCQSAFEAIKAELAKEPVVQPYSLSKEVTVTTDASETTIAGCLTQNGHPVIFVSRNLTSAERNYPNLEREALAVVWTLERLKHFLLGRCFTLTTDHEPLVKLFGEKQCLPKSASARITNWAIRLMPFDYTIGYKPGTEITHVDALSRLRTRDNNEKDDIAVIINSVAFEKCVMNMKDVQEEYRTDEFLQRLMARVSKTNWSRCSQLEKQFAKHAERLTVEDGVIFHGTRMLIPPRLRHKAIEVAHECHSGYQSTLTRLKLSAWWPNMSADVRIFVEQCEKCNNIRPRQGKSTDKWPVSKPLERWHMDWCWLLIAMFSFSWMLVQAG